MKKNAVISAIVLTIGIIFTSCGDVYNTEYNGDMYYDNSSNQSQTTNGVEGEGK